MGNYVALIFSSIILTMERQYVSVIFLMLIFGSIYFYQTDSFSTRETGSVVAFERIAEGENAAISQRVNYRINTEEKLTQLWQELNVEPPPPSIDFSRNEVAAVFAGLAPYYGSDIGVIKVVDSEEARTVLVELKMPDSECSGEADAVSPFELIVFPKTALRLAHIDQPVQVSCPQ